MQTSGRRTGTVSYEPHDPDDLISVGGEHDRCLPIERREAQLYVQLTVNANPEKWTSAQSAPSRQQRTRCETLVLK